MVQTAARAERKKRTVQEIRESKNTGEKMVYMSVPGYTAARWAKAAGVDVEVVGTFPDDDHSYGVDEKEYEKFLTLVEKRRRQ